MYLVFSTPITVVVVTISLSILLRTTVAPQNPVIGSRYCNCHVPEHSYFPLCSDVAYMPVQVLTWQHMAGSRTRDLLITSQTP